MTSETHQATIRTSIETWVAAIDAADPAGAVRDRTDDVVMFDVPPPHDGARGTDAYRATWPPFLDFQASGAVFELVELDVTAGDDVAWAFALLRCGTPEELAAHPERRLRLTLGLRREDGRWLVAHEHHSFALDASYGDPGPAASPHAESTPEGAGRETPVERPPIGPAAPLRAAP